MTLLDKFKLDGKVGIVTGAVQGIGKALSEALAEAGADLLIVTKTQTSRLEDVADQINNNTGQEVVTHQVDVTSEEDVKSMVRKAESEFGKADILVNNAGIAKAEQAVKMDLEDFKSIIDVNITGTFLCARETAKLMKKKETGGSIINISSIYGLMGDYVPNAPYYSSKAGIINLTRGLSIEWGPHGIRVNTICPGWFPTPGNKGFRESEEWLEYMNGKIPLGRIGKLEDLKPVIVFIASEASGYISGHTFKVTGGPASVSGPIIQGIKYLDHLIDREYIEEFGFAKD